MAEAVVDVLEVVHVNHGEREPTLQILEPLVVVAAVVDLDDRVHIHLPVAHEQLVEHIFALEHVIALDALDQLERIRPAVHLDERREHIIDIALARFDLRLWLVRAQHLLRNAVFTAALLFPHRVAVLALFKRVALIRFRQLHTDARVDQPRDVKDAAIGHCIDDLGLGAFVVISVQALEALLKSARLLTRAHGLDKGLRETGHVVFKALRHRIARTDILGHLFEHPTCVLAAALRGDHLHTAHHGKACGQDAGSNAPGVP